MRDITKQIVELEWAMFGKVQNRGGRRLAGAAGRTLSDPDRTRPRDPQRRGQSVVDFV